MGRNLANMLRHSLKQVVVLWLVLLVGILLTIVIINMGGALDEMRRNQIRFQVSESITANPDSRFLPASELQQLIRLETELAFRAQNLDQPFIVRVPDYMWHAMTLNLGRSDSMTSDSGSRVVRNILLERLPPTLLLFATAELFLFLFCIFGALFLSRRYGSFLDRLVIALAPTSAAPGWFYGLFLIMIFAAILRVLPWGGMLDAPVPPPRSLAYALSLARHLILPAGAIVLGAIFANIYSWRTFFLIYSSEDYVELAKAKGLSSQAIERRYILRPTLPPIVTTFLLWIIVMWTGAVILETVFNWPGLGRLLFEAVGRSDTPVIVGSIVIYGYLLAVTVFLLDFIYAALDPRVRVGGGTTR